MPRRSAPLFVAVTSMTLVACSFLLDDSFSSGGDDAGGSSDAQGDVTSSPDTSVVSDSGNGDAVTVIDGGADADSGVVIFREDFEQGCGQWQLDKVVLSSVQGHTGMGCRMCATAAATSIAMEKNLTGPKAGETYTLDVWIRKGTATGPQKMYLALESEVNGGNPKDEFSSSFAQDWQKITLTHTTVPNLSYLVVHLGATDALMNECVDVDDVVVTRK